MMATPTTTTTICKPEVVFTPSDEFSPTILKSTKRPSAMKRKFSFPVNLHSSTLLTTESNVIARTTRRLSTNVSDRVSERVRKLSTAMGLGWNHSPSKEILLSQAKYLVTLYIRFRLKRSGILNQQKKKLGLAKIQRSMLGIGDVKEVFLAIKEACSTLEQLHTKVYTNITRQISSSVGNTIEDPEELVMGLSTIGKFLFKTDVTWGKVCSLFSITASLSVELVRSNQEEHLPKLVEGFLGIVEEELVSFLSEEHGWIALYNKLVDRNRNMEFYYVTSSIFLLIIIVLFFFINNYLLKF